MGFCNCSMFCCAFLGVHFTFAIISMGKGELVALLCLSSSYLVIVVWLFLTMPRVCLQFVIVVFHCHAHSLFLEMTQTRQIIRCSHTKDKVEDTCKNLDI